MSREVLFSAPPWFEVWREQVMLPDGRIIPDYYKLVVPDATVVVAMTAKKEVVMLRQYKHGVGCTVWNLPAGFCMEGESPPDCARRELLEETGYRSEQWISLGNYVRDGNRGGGSVYVFLALDAEKVAEPDSRDLEESQVHHLKMKDLLGLIRNQQIEPVGVVAAVLLANLYLEANKERNS